MSEEKMQENSIEGLMLRLKNNAIALSDLLYKKYGERVPWYMAKALLRHIDELSETVEHFEKLSAQQGKQG